MRLALLALLLTGCVSRGPVVACAVADIATSTQVVEGNPLITSTPVHIALKGLLTWPLMRPDTPRWLRRLTSGLWCGGALWNWSLSHE